MAFNSLIYLFFLGITSMLYYVFPIKLRWIWLLVASLLYYISFIPVFISVIIAMVSINFFLAKSVTIVNSKKTNLIFVFIVLINVLILAFFKYFNFFFDNIHVLLFNFDLFYRTDPINKMVLPIGLSYLTFTLLSYHIELKRKNITLEKHFGYFTLYCVFFPRVSQGPIEKPQNLLTQIHNYQPFNYSNVVDGLKLIIWGFFKKLVIADRLAIFVNSVYNNSEHHSGATLIIATLFFAFQIYTDFSSYTDIAIGSAKIFGFKLSENFKRPYLANSIKEFWNRWHISFSTWLRDYVFLPIAFYLSKKMIKNKYFFISTDKWIYFISIMITFLICGIWHGEGLTFIIWGLLYGIYLTYSHWTAKYNLKIRRYLGINKSNFYFQFYKIIVTFLLVSLAWIFFRTNSLKEAFRIIEEIFSFSKPLFYDSPATLIYSIFGIIVIILKETKNEFYKGSFSFFNNKHRIVRNLSYITIIILILLIGVFDGGQFIYFQF